MPTVVMVEQYFYPDGWGGAEIPRDIAIALRHAGYEVGVLCSRDQYVPAERGEVSTDPTAHGVRIHRVPSVISGPIHRGKLLRIVWFCAYALPWLLCRARVDLYVTQTNPLLIVPVVAMAALLRGRPFVIVAQDLYPEALFASGVLATDSLRGRLLRRLFAWSYRRARCVVALGSGMQRRILEKGVSADRIRIISNWATGNIRAVRTRDNPLRGQWGLAERFVVLYSGNLGIGHEFETLLRGAAQAVWAGADLALAFVGRGVRLGEVRGLVDELGLTDRVVFRDFVPAEALPLTLGVADLAVVTLRAGFEGIVVPSKLLGYIARGIPALYVGPDSDAADIVRQGDCGCCCATGDATAVAQLLIAVSKDDARLRRWAENGRCFYSTHFARELATGRYVELVDKILAG